MGSKTDTFAELTLKNIPPQGLPADSARQDTDTLDLNEQKKIRFGQDTRHRKVLVYWMMAVVSLWLAAVLLILVFNRKLEIANEILITLLATTTINVLGLANIILNGLFGKGTSARKKNSSAG